MRTWASVCSIRGSTEKCGEGVTLPRRKASRRIWCHMLCDRNPSLANHEFGSRHDRDAEPEISALSQHCTSILTTRSCVLALLVMLKNPDDDARLFELLMQVCAVVV